MHSDFEEVLFRILEWRRFWIDRPKVGARGLPLGVVLSMDICQDELSNRSTWIQ